jgi:hypothetical protein
LAIVAKRTPAGDIIATEKALYRAMIDADLEALGVLLAPDLAYIHSNGVLENRIAYLAQVKKGFYRYERIAGRRVKTERAGGMVLRRGILVMDVATDGGPVTTVTLHHTLVWRRQGRNWQLLLRQATRIP